MKLILAIISDELINEVSKELSDSEFNTTKLSSTGGFRKKGNTTIIIGAEKEKVAKCVEIIRSTILKSSKRNPDDDIADANIFVMPMIDMRKM
ncbi:cyclic-di-AMP receptor [Microaceticoccus formicicus]|uniref:cyclic-di-AMP receptor n=1 Tax=Microaceticoccus formicicus TaxID=3118105 RepID=UPI003CD0068C|nr:cyclic-di-AMP receptor [Peptoniphilaceae bacterium AMB_02]